MSEPSEFQFSDQSVPPAYERFYRPRIFDPLALVLLERLRLRPGMHVLDIATGPGTVARIAAQRVGAGGAVTGADISPLMLNIARSKPAQPDAAPIEYVLSPASPLAVPDAAFDAIVCQQGLQFFGDCAASLAEMRRALRPGGRVAVAVWCEIESCPMFHGIWNALRETGHADLAELYRAPFTMSGARLHQELTAAGFDAVEVDRIELPLVFEGGVMQVVAGIAGSPVGPKIAALPESEQDAFFAAAERNAQGLISNGQVRTHMTTSIGTATR